MTYSKTVNLDSVFCSSENQQRAMEGQNGGSTSLYKEKLSQTVKTVKTVTVSLHFLCPNKSYKTIKTSSAQAEFVASVLREQ